MLLGTSTCKRYLQLSTQSPIHSRGGREWEISSPRTSKLRRPLLVCVLCTITPFSLSLVQQLLLSCLRGGLYSSSDIRRKKTQMSFLVAATYFTTSHGPPVQSKLKCLGTGSQPHGGQRLYFFWGRKVVGLKPEVPEKYLEKVNAITSSFVFQSIFCSWAKHLSYSGGLIGFQQPTTNWLYWSNSQ